MKARGNSMLYIVWNDINKLGIPIIDEQHRGIVATINSFHYFIQEGHGLEALKPTLKILEQYTCIHFKTEEALMKEAECPDLERHIILHDELMKRTKEIALEAVSHEEPELALVFLKEWWLSHISEEDKLYGSCIKRHLGIQ